ncbi:MAG: hypothetical protein AAFN70_14920, partial [Planctomycetota bacterium]
LDLHLACQTNTADHGNSDLRARGKDAKSDSLLRIIASAVAKNPEDRFKSVAGLRQALTLVADQGRTSDASQQPARKKKSAPVRTKEKTDETSAARRATDSGLTTSNPDPTNRGVMADPTPSPTPPVAPPPANIPTPPPSTPLTSSDAAQLASTEPSPDRGDETDTSQRQKRGEGLRRNRRKKKNTTGLVIVGGLATAVLVMLVMVLAGGSLGGGGGSQVAQRQAQDLSQLQTDGSATANRSSSTSGGPSAGGDVSNTGGGEDASSADEGESFQVADQSSGFLWVPPWQADSPPSSLQLLPSGPSLIATFRTEAITDTDEGRALLSALQPELQPLVQNAIARSGVQPRQMRRLTIAVEPGSSTRPAVALAVQLRQPTSIQTLRGAWKAEAGRTPDGTIMFAGDSPDGDAYFALGENLDQDDSVTDHFAVGSMEQIKRVVEQQGAEILLPR